MPSLPEPAHSARGASSAYRWGPCPGSVALCARAPKPPDSPYAEEGTNAHRVGEMAFASGQAAAEAIPTEWNTKYPDMAEAVQVYLDHVRESMEPEDILLVEYKFRLPHLFPDCMGTGDVLWYRPSQRKLFIRDYKHGRGVPVEVGMNPQLLYYATGGAFISDWTVEEIDYGVVQPRCPHPDGPVRTSTIDIWDLLDWTVDLTEKALACDDPNAPLVPGDHCRFCDAAPICPAKEKAVLDVAMVEFDDAGAPTLAVPNPADLSPVQLSRALNVAGLVESWIKAVRAYGHSEAEHGRSPVGFKLVRGRANRAWRDDTEVQQTLNGMGFDDDEVLSVPKLKSPAQIEKLIKGHPQLKEVTALIVKPQGKTALVPESDKRELVKPEAASEFDDVAETDKPKKGKSK